MMITRIMFVYRALMSRKLFIAILIRPPVDSIPER